MEVEPIKIYQEPLSMGQHEPSEIASTTFGWACFEAKCARLRNIAMQNRTLPLTITVIVVQFFTTIERYSLTVIDHLDPVRKFLTNGSFWHPIGNHARQSIIHPALGEAGNREDLWRDWCSLNWASVTFSNQFHRNSHGGKTTTNYHPDNGSTMTFLSYVLIAGWQGVY